MTVENTIHKAEDIKDVDLMKQLRQEYSDALRDRPTKAPLILQEIILENDRLQQKSLND
jgi:hypothetical protein